jgi:hypothetical protein
MSLDRQRKMLALVAVLMSALALAGCATSIADMPLAGTPADAPARPKEAGAFLPVNDLPPEREEATMDPKQRAKIQAELAAARDRQASAIAGKDTAAKHANDPR